MDKNIIDKDTFLFIYKNICILNSIPYDDSDITDDDISGDNYLIIYSINKMVKQIVILTNRNEFPTDLKYLVIDLVNDSIGIINSEKSPSTNQNINSMSEAGRSVSFGATETWKAKYNLLLNQQLETQKNLINRYKLLYKVECPYAKN